MLTITGPVDVDDGLYLQAADFAQKLAKENLQAHTPSLPLWVLFWTRAA